MGYRNTIYSVYSPLLFALSVFIFSNVYVTSFSPYRILSSSNPSFSSSSSSFVSLLASTGITDSTPEPYPWLNNGSFTGKYTNASVDPLVMYQWNSQANYNSLQVLPLPPTSVLAYPVDNVQNISSLMYGYRNGSAIVSNTSTLMVDWGIEHAAWIEISLTSSLPSYITVQGVISEYNTPRPGNPITFTAIPKGNPNEYRLVTNPQYYDGLRYGWITINFQTGCSLSSCPPITLTGIRSVGQVLPLNYTGYFSSNDYMINRLWYQGAYAVRVNLIPGFFGSELYDRGDRSPPFQGDAHVAQVVGLTAFGGTTALYDNVKSMLSTTDSAAHSVHDSNIATYPLLWTLSVRDYWLASGDTQTFVSYAKDISTILDSCIANFQNWTNPTDLRWSGWDDRLGSGFIDVDLTDEARRYYWMTTLRATARFASACTTIGGAVQSYADKYTSITNTLVAQLRSVGPNWFIDGGYGLHSLAAAINGGWTSSTEQQSMFSIAFNDSAHICSLSNFDSGFILLALAEMGHIDYGMAMLRLCWVRQIEAGATCLWESTNFYDFMLNDGINMDLLPGATTSSCHAWGAYPTTWISQFVTGVQAIESGYQKFLVRSAFSMDQSKGLSSIEGIVPVPYDRSIQVTGSIILCVNDTTDSFENFVPVPKNVQKYLLSTQITYPSSSQPVIEIPLELDNDFLQLSHVAFTDSVHVQRIFWNPRFTDTMNYSSVLPTDAKSWENILPIVTNNLGKQYLQFTNEIGENTNSVAIVTIQAIYLSFDTDTSTTSSSSFADDYPYPPFTPPVWPTVITLDNTTHGSWINKLGNDGYVLLGYNGPSNTFDVSKLPPYIASVTVSTSVRTFINDSSLVPSVALLSDPEGGNPRLGAAWVGDLFSLWVDVNFTSSSRPLLGSNPLYNLWVDINMTNSHTVSLYITDTAQNVAVPQSIVIHAEDAVTRSTIAPDVLLRHYVPPVPYGGIAPPYNQGGYWGLENGIYAQITYNSSFRLRVYCVSGCYASVSGIFFD